MDLLLAPATSSWLLASLLKAALLLATSWIAAMLWRRGTAAARHQLWTLGVSGALLLPFISLVLPSLRLSLDAPATGPGRVLVATASLVTAGPARGGATPAAASSWPSWIAIIWAAGALLVALRFLRGHLAARRLARTAGPARAESWLVALTRAAASLGMAGDVELGRSEDIGSPMTIGVLRPRVLLPAAADTWSGERLVSVLTHELGHVRRRDTLIQLVAQLGCALYWCNPLAWLAASRLRAEREHACDDLVLQAGALPSSYAADLLELARFIEPADTAQVGAVCMAAPSIETRLRRILDPEASRRPLGARFRVATRAAMLACAVGLACTSTSASSPAAAATVAAVPLREHEAHGNLALAAPFIRRDGAVDDLPPRAVDDLPPPALMANDPDMAGAREAVERRMGELKACYERRLLAHPGLSGEVVIHAGISTTGEVEERCITKDTVHDPELRACVNALIAGTRFPAAYGESVDVSFPFTFQADQPRDRQ